MQGFSRVYIGIGSNLGKREENCRKAIDAVSEIQCARLLSKSSLYETEPLGVKDQPWFINCVVSIDTSLTPEELLKELHKIEKKMGRTSDRKWMPRIIDLDILFFNDQFVDSSQLVIPHPEAHRRRFVLQPLLEIAPDFVHPVLKKKCSVLLKALGQGQRCIKVPRGSNIDKSDIRGIS